MPNLWELWYRQYEERERQSVPSHDEVVLRIQAMYQEYRGLSEHDGVEPMKYEEWLELFEEHSEDEDI